eukprot:3105250-Pyramimonas_sp.AAC.1
MSRARSLCCSPHGSRVAVNRRSGLSEDGASTEGGGRWPLADSTGMQEYLELPRDEASLPWAASVPG